MEELENDLREALTPNEVNGQIESHEHQIYLLRNLVIQLALIAIKNNQVSKDDLYDIINKLWI